MHNHPTDEDLSVGTPINHPTDEDLSVGTPINHPRLSTQPTSAHLAPPGTPPANRSMHLSGIAAEDRPGAGKLRRRHNFLPFQALGPLSLPWSWRRDLNPRPSDYKSDALPAELRQPIPPGNRPGIPEIRAGTLTPRTHHGIEIKVSTPPASGANRERQGLGTKGLGTRKHFRANPRSSSQLPIAVPDD